MKKSIKKHVPMRTCIACKGIKPKRELLRIVCSSEGAVSVDETGKKEGRGAYLCKEMACWEAGLKGNRIEHHLKIKISPEVKEMLERYAREAFVKGK